MRRIELEYPITVGGETIKAVTLRRPTAGDLRAMDKAKGGDVDKGITLLLRLVQEDMTPEQVDAMDVKDFRAASEVVADFLA